MTIPTDPQGTNPVVFETQTLGNPVRLGELYDQRSRQFLGVQLYSEENIEVVETDIKHTDLSLSLATTLEDKASLLDINAKLSLEILSGAVKVSGSASYIKDTKANTNVQAFALALKMRLNEKRILFAEPKLGRNVLRIASEDYIANGAATHFVSAIVYGGSLIVNLVARQEKLDTEEKLEGQLKAKFEKMTGGISLEGEVKAEIKDTFSSMDDKFDLVMHGDVALDRVPVNPKDVMDIIPNAAELIKGGGGVPISVTLQPIPLKLIDARLVYEIDARFVDEVMKTFSELDDLRSRFSVLVDGTKSVEEFVPELALVARATAVQYAEDHGSLLLQLRKFLDDYQHGKPLTDDWKAKPGTSYIPVLLNATNLRKYHLELEDGEAEDEEGEGQKKAPSSDHYWTTLVGLEKELLKFQYFVADLQESRGSLKSLDAAFKQYVSLSSLDTISRAIRHQDTIPLFVMSPFTPKQPGIPTCISVTQTTDLSVIQFLAILRENVQYFNDSYNPARILYAETLKNLKIRLPGVLGDSIPQSPALKIGKVSVDGKLSWHDPPAITEVHSKLYHKSTGGNRGDLSYFIEGVNGKNSFTFQVYAKDSNSASGANSVMCMLKTKSNKVFLTFHTQPRLEVQIRRNPGYPSPARLNSDRTFPSDKPSVVTFVQDLETRLWTFYLGNTKIDDAKFTSALELLDDSDELQVVYPEDTTWWKGEVYGVRGFSYAFTQEQVEAEAKKAENVAITRG